MNNRKITQTKPITETEMTEKSEETALLAVIESVTNLEDRKIRDNILRLLLEFIEIAGRANRCGSGNDGIQDLTEIVN